MKLGAIVVTVLRQATAFDCSKRLNTLSNMARTPTFANASEVCNLSTMAQARCSDYM